VCAVQVETVDLDVLVSIMAPALGFVWIVWLLTVSKYLLLGLGFVFGCSLTQPASTEVICAEMEEVYNTGGVEGLAEWLSPKYISPTVGSGVYYPKSRVLACAIQVGRSG
jgi:hypothetical protein